MKSGDSVLPITTIFLVFILLLNTPAIHIPWLYKFSRKDVFSQKIHESLIEAYEEERVQRLLNFWNSSYFKKSSKEDILPVAPHLQNCSKNSELALRLDKCDGKHDFFPPWVEGSDEVNLPMTRLVQRDLWLHQHPRNCSDENVKFFVADWVNIEGLGLGAQIVATAGMLAIALHHKRVLVLKEFNRAKHDECIGSSYALWSCYFVHETSEECRTRVTHLESKESSWRLGIITNMNNHSKQELWTGQIPRYWGKPWEEMQPFDVVDGHVLSRHNAMDKQWWRAQVVKYLTRYPSEYMCNLLNKARHQAFGKLAAEITIRTLPKTWPEVQLSRNYTEVERLVWVNHKPWSPRPLLSMHVRQGDKASEMRIFDFKTHMMLADQVRSRFPHLRDIWLSTEMQSAVDESLNYSNWRFYFTGVPRQHGTTSMAAYEARLGTKLSSTNAFVNLLLAVDCDYFIGSLGSTWSFLIDGLRATSGKLTSGFLSVNKDRYWTSYLLDKNGVLLLLCFACTLILILAVIRSPSEHLSQLMNSHKGVRIIERVINSTSSNCREVPANNDNMEDNRTEQIRLLMDIWKSSSYLKEDTEVSNEELLNIPRPPHLENCKEKIREYAKLDSRGENGERPRWTLWKGLLGYELGKHVPPVDNGEEMLLNKTLLLQGPLPPWVDGGEEDNLPMTRRVQSDIWLHQHPKNCRDPSLKFLYINFSTDPGWGTGAQLNAISGMFSVAMNDNRILVLEYFNRADHQGCKGDTRSRWTCYFIAETSKECRQRALELIAIPEAKKNRTITDASSYWGGATWFTPIPTLWGTPWENEQPTSQVNGEIIVQHKEMHVWWWRAQAIRYLTRYPSEYLCTLMNRARHDAFGHAAAAIVVDTLPKDWPKVAAPARNITALEKVVWTNHIHRPWIPRPMISVHVRQGDKGWEMKLFDFKFYMELAQNLRRRFPDARHIWLSTEMQNVVDESRSYTSWNFYYTSIIRQTGGTKMRDYETSLGRFKASNNAFVNLMMAVDCDYFIGALGSSWGSVIDGLRSTSGKVLAGFVSVNPGQFWFKQG